MQNLDIISINIWQVVISLANLVILFLILKKFLFEPVKKIKAQRENEIETQYKKAEKARKEADDDAAERMWIPVEEVRAELFGLHSISQAVGRFLGYAVAYADDFYVLKRFLALGRVTSGLGGDVILETAKTMLKDVYPEWAEKIELVVPDEHFRRLGQSVAAAQIPVIKKAPAKKPAKKAKK